MRPRKADTPGARSRERVYSGADDLTGRVALLTGVGDPNGSIEVTWTVIDQQAPDPGRLLSELRRQLAQVKKDRPRDLRLHKYYERVVSQAQEYVQFILLPDKRDLTLSECIQIALANNYTIRIEAINPAVSQTDVIEAEAAFDATFFLDASYDNRDQAVATDLAAGQSDTRRMEAGLRQLLPSGMQVQTSIRHSRQFVPFQFQQLNPAYDTTFVASFTQPLLRGFGLDVNRAQIEIARLDFRISDYQFQEQVRDTLLDVERAYWRLFQARREAAIQAEAVAQNWATFKSIFDRRTNDASQVEIQAAKARWRSREVDLMESIRVLRDAEDQLKGLLQDDEMLLSRRMELIPTDQPIVTPLVVDQFAEVRTALEHRTEIAQARTRVEQSRIRKTVARNQLLPQLDVTFNYEVQGLGGSADDSFDGMTTNRFRSYTVGIALSVPIGNRAAQAQDRRANLQQKQAVVALYQAYDAVVFEVNQAVRQLIVRGLQIPSTLGSASSNRDSLRALQAKTTKIDPGFLEAELNSIARVTNDRRNLINQVIEHTLAIAELERAKGTLLAYNGVQLNDGR